jgi:hypothetical protein
MSTSTRYHVIPDKGGNGVIIFDSETGAIQYPACWQDLAAYYYYLVERGRIEESQKLLADSMAGNKPITSMVTALSKSVSADNDCR